MLGLDAASRAVAAISLHSFPVGADYERFLAQLGGDRRAVGLARPAARLCPACAPTTPTLRPVPGSRGSSSCCGASPGPDILQRANDDGACPSTATNWTPCPPITPWWQPARPELGGCPSRCPKPSATTTTQTLARFDTGLALPAPPGRPSPRAPKLAGADGHRGSRTRQWTSLGPRAPAAPARSGRADAGAGGTCSQLLGQIDQRSGVHPGAGGSSSSAPASGSATSLPEARVGSGSHRHRRCPQKALANTSGLLSGCRSRYTQT